MKELTQEQIGALKAKGLSDNEISSLAQKKGFALPAPIPAKQLSVEQVNSLKENGLSDIEIGTIAQKKGFALPTPEKEVGGFQGFVQAVAQPFLQVVSSAGATAQILAGNDKGYQNTQDKGVDYGYFGNAKPVGSGFDVTKGISENIQPIKSAIGTGAEIASAFIGGGGTSGVVRSGLKGAIKAGAKEGLIAGASGGGTQAFGQAIADAENQASDIAYKTLFGTVLGGAGGLALGALTPFTIKGVTKGKQFIELFNDINSVNTKLKELNLQVFKPTKTQLKKFGDRDVIGTYTDMFGTKLPQTDKNNRFIKESVDELVNEVNDAYTPASEAFSTILKNSPEVNSLSQARNDAVKNLDFYSLTPAARGKAIKKIDEEFNALYSEAKSRGWVKGEDNLPVFYSDAFKDRYWKATKNFGTEDASISNAVNSSIGHAFKDGIETAVKDINVQNFNKKLGDMIVLRDFISDLAGKQSGTGGTMTRLLAGRVAGTVAGSTGGIPGAIAGNITGDMIARIMINPEYQPYRWLINKKLAQLPPQVKTKLEDEANAVIEQMFKKRMETLALPAPKPLGSVENPIITPAPTTFEAPAQKATRTRTNKTGDVYQVDLKTGKTKVTPNIKPKVTVGKTVDPLMQEAKKYKSAEEFVKAQEDKLYIHGTQKKIEGKLELKSKASGVQTPEKDAVDVLYVTPNTETGKMHSRMYTKQNGVTYAIKLKPEAKIFDYTNPSHRKMIEKTMTESQKKLVNDNLVDGQLSWMATPPVKNVKKLGFDGMKQIERKAGEDAYSATFGDAKYSENAESLMLFNKNVFEQVDTVQTKSQLTDIWNKANKKAVELPKATSLEQEAKKYKSAEDFIKNNKGNLPDSQLEQIWIKQSDLKNKEILNTDIIEEAGNYTEPKVKQTIQKIGQSTLDSKNSVKDIASMFDNPEELYKAYNPKLGFLTNLKFPLDKSLIGTQMKGLEMRGSTAPSPRLKSPPIKVSYNINTKELTLDDGYHRINALNRSQIKPEDISARIFIHDNSAKPTKSQLTDLYNKAVGKK